MATVYEVDELEQAGTAERVVMRQRPMREWVYVGTDRPDEWPGLVAEAFAFVDEITP